MWMSLAASAMASLMMRSTMAMARPACLGVHGYPHRRRRPRLRPGILFLLQPLEPLDVIEARVDPVEELLCQVDPVRIGRIRMGVKWPRVVSETSS